MKSQVLRSWGIKKNLTLKWHHVAINDKGQEPSLGQEKSFFFLSKYPSYGGTFLMPVPLFILPMCTMLRIWKLKTIFIVEFISLMETTEKYFVWINAFRLPMQETQELRVWFLGWEDPLEEGMTTHCSVPAWRIPWTEEPGGLQSMGSRKESDMTESMHTNQLIINTDFWVCIDNYSNTEFCRGSPLHDSIF